MQPNKVVIINSDNEFFPESLKKTSDGPKRLYCRGNMDLLKARKMLAVVGSRQRSDYGEKVLTMVIPDLVKKGVVIVSGMALGVDEMAQRLCLRAGGRTIAVLASGVELATPKVNRGLYEAILEKEGLIVSESPGEYAPNKIDFLKRNRIVAGMARGVLVIEGGKNSGTLVTARLAVEQGKDVWAVPGRITDENSITPNYLIQNGAALFSGVEEMGWEKEAG